MYVKWEGVAEAVGEMKEASREMRLLILAARVDLGAEDAARIKEILRQAVDWPMVMRLAAGLRIGPLLYKHLSDPRNSGYVPGEAVTFFQRDYYHHSLKNLQIYGCIRRILESTQQSGIPVILLKGAFLAKWVYGDIALRPMSDIDILCRKEDHREVLEKLFGLGFQKPEAARGSFNSPMHQKVVLDHGVHLRPIYSPRIARVEVHSHILKNGSEAGRSEIWMKSTCSTWDDLAFNTLSAKHQVLYLCTHLFRHLSRGNANFSWFCDIHEVIRYYDGRIDWEALERTAEEVGERTRVNSILHLLKKHWNTPVPEIRGNFKRVLLTEMIQDLFAVAGPKKRRAVLYGYWGRIKMAGQVEGWPDRVYFLWKLIFPSKENIVYRYHPANSFTFCLWCAAHPFILAGRLLESIIFIYNSRYFLKKKRA